MAKLQRGGAAPKTVRKPAPSSWLASSDDLVADDMIISVHGPRGSGKSTLAASVAEELQAIKNWPPNQRGTTKTKVNSILWCAFDAGATNCLVDRGIVVQNVLSFNRMVKSGMSTFQALAEMQKQIVAWCKDNPEGWVVADTVTTLGDDLEIYWGPRTPDSWKKWAAVLESHKRFHESIKFAAGRAIYLFHSKDKVPVDDNKKQKATEKATRSPGNPLIVPSISGAGGNCYLNDSSIILVMAAESKLGKGGKRDLIRTVYTQQQSDFEAKNRFGLCLDDQEEAHLGGIVAKIRKAAK